MKNYIVIVRNFMPYLGQPSDERLMRLAWYYQSPVVSLDWEGNRNKALDEFDEKFGKYFSDFLYVHYQLIEV